MLTYARELGDHEELRADLCIIGSGPAGLTVAHRLLGKGFDTIVLESGGDAVDDSQLLNDGAVIGRPYRQLVETRLRAFGGTMNHWGGHCRPLDPLDFAVRPWVPYSGWPIAYRDLAPYYDETTYILALGTDEWDPQRLPLPSYTGAAFHLSRSVTVKLSQSVVTPRPEDLGTLAHQWRDDFTTARDVSVFLKAQVTGIRLTDDAQRVAYVEFDDYTGKRRRVISRYTVLAAGGIENARVLLSSNDISSQGIGNYYGVVGRYFMEHLHIGGGHLITNDAVEALRRFTRGTRIGGAVHVIRLQPRETVMIREEILNQSYILHDFGASNPIRERLNDNTLSQYYEQGGVMLEVVLWCEQAPNPDSLVLLGDERDRFGLRRVMLNWKLTTLDEWSIRRGMELIARDLGASNIGRMRPARWDDFDSLAVSGGSHHMGTTRMHDDPRRGVVDRDCRVHGVANLYVAGSSVFPTGGYAPPTQTIIALALRLADHLKQELRDG